MKNLDFQKVVSLTVPFVLINNFIQNQFLEFHQIKNRNSEFFLLFFQSDFGGLFKKWNRGGLKYDHSFPSTTHLVCRALREFTNLPQSGFIEFVDSIFIIYYLAVPIVKDRVIPFEFLKKSLKNSGSRVIRKIRIL